MGRAEDRAREKLERQRLKEEREERERHKKRNKVWNDLCEEEKKLLIELKEQEIQEALDRILMKTLNDMFDKLKKNAIKSLKEHRISEARIQEIIADFLLYVDNEQGFRYADVSLKDDYMIMERVKYHETIKDLVCETLHYRCKGCSTNKKNCSLYPIYKRLDIPTSSYNKKNCKYSYD